MNKDINEVIAELNEIIVQDKSIISLMFTPSMKTILVHIYDNKRFREYAEACGQEIEHKVVSIHEKNYKMQQFSLPLGEYRIDYICYADRR